MSERLKCVPIIGVDCVMRPGFYRARLVKGGPFVAIVLAEIAPQFDADGEPMYDYVYTLTVDGEPRCPYTHAPLFGEPVAEGEADYIAKTRAYDRRHETPLADARQRIDPLQSPLPF